MSANKGRVESVPLARLYELYTRLPEFERPEPLEALGQRAGGRYLSLVYCENGEDLGFKLGYAVDDRQFYSWLGGVLPEGRGRGIAQALLEAQETWVAEQGFSEIRVKSMNRFPAMIRLLVRNGYFIDGVTPNADARLTKIHFVKGL